MGLALGSNVRYARLPRMGIRTRHGLLGLGVNLIIIAGALWARDIFFFPLGLAYLSYGLVRAAVEGLLERAEDAAEERARKAGIAIHGTDSGARLRRREPGANDG